MSSGLVPGLSFKGPLSDEEDPFAALAAERMKQQGQVDVRTRQEEEERTAAAQETKRQTALEELGQLRGVPYVPRDTEARHHALAAKVAADAKLTYNNRTGEAHASAYGQPGDLVNHNPGADPMRKAFDSSLKYNEGLRTGTVKPVPRAADPNMPVPGIRAFRTRDGKTTFTNLPGRYNPAEEVDYKAGIRDERAESAATEQGPAPDPQNVSSASLYALVQRARGHTGDALPAPGEAGLFSQMGLKPGAEGIGTPGYNQMVEGVLSDRARMGGIAAQGAVLAQTPEDRARLAAYVKDAGNNQLGVQRFVAEEIDRRANDVTRAEIAWETIQNDPREAPEMKARVKAELDAAKARQTGFYHGLTVTNKGNQFFDMDPQQAGNNEVTPQ